MFTTNIHGPCKDCAERHIACWATCHKYAEYQQKLCVIKAAERAEKQLDEMTKSYKWDWWNR